MRHLAGARAIFRTYWQHTLRYPWLLVFVVLATALIQVGELAAPLYLRQFFNLIATSAPSPETVRTLVRIIAIVGSISLAVWTARRVFGFTLMYFELRIMRDLIDSGFDGLMRHSYHFFISRFAGSLTHKVNKYSRAYETMADSIVLQFIPTLLFVGGAIVILFLRHPALGIVLALWSVVFVGFQLVVAKMRQPLRVERAERETETTGALADAIGNHTTATLFSGIGHENSLIADVTRRWYEAAIRSWKADEWIWGGLGVLMIIIEVALLSIATVLWQRGLLTVGDFVLIQAYLLTTFERLVAINRELRRFYDAYADASEMVGLLELPRDITDAPDAGPLVVAQGQIDFKNVDFRFSPAAAVFEKFNLSVRPREKVALVGPSGAGKSTVTRLLLRLYDVQGGSIEIDGEDIRSVTQESLRGAIAFVPQEPLLFHRTLMENIRYGRRSASDEEVIAAAKKAHCHEFIATQSRGYDTFVGERGVKLSGGERQRVAIARAFLKNAPILVLDEATSSLDSESESLIQDALKELMRDKTVIVIAHRLSTIMKMDRILVIEKGRIAAEGSHADLLRGGGLYHRLWNIQAGGFVGDAAIETVEPATDDSRDKDAPASLPPSK